MQLRNLLTIAKQEWTVTMRNRWTALFAGIFALLVTGLASAGILVEGYAGLQNFTRTSASLLNLVLYVIPLFALVMGTLSFAGDRGTAELLLSQPLSRMEVLLGKLLGLFFSVAASTLGGFAAAGGVIAYAEGTDGLWRYAAFVGLSLVLALIFLGLAMLASAGRSRPRAFGMALFFWFFLVLFYDLLVLGAASLMVGRGANTFLFLSVLTNPVDLVRVGTLIILDNITIFGAAGAAMLRFLGGPIACGVFLAAGLLVWVSVPLIITRRMMRGLDL